MQRRNLLRLKVAIAVGDPKLGIDVYEQIFRDTEVAYVLIMNAEKAIVDLQSKIKSKQGGNDIYSTELKHQRAMAEAQMKIFAKNFGEYVASRTLLEAIVAGVEDQLPNTGATAVVSLPTAKIDAPVGSTDRFRITAANILANLGNHEVANFAPGLNIPDLRPPIGDVQTLFDTRGQAQMIALQLDVHEQTGLTMRNIIRLSAPIVAVLKRIISTKLFFSTYPAYAVKALTDFYNLTYDVDVRDRWIPYIEIIMAAPEDGNFRLNLLQEYNNIVKSDEMLITFARLAKGMAGNTWVDLIKQVARLNANTPETTLYADLLKRMKSAEAMANTLGGLSMIYDEPDSEWVAPIALTATGFVAMATHHTKVWTLPDLHTLLTMAHHVLEQALTLL